MVGALTEDPAIKRYAQRKRALRSTHRRGRLARWSTSPSPTRSPGCATRVLTGTPLSDRKLRHYPVTLQLALAAGLAPGLCEQLDELIAQAAALSA